MLTQILGKPVILVIEDYRDSREMLKLILENLGYRVLAAANGDEALAMAVSNRVELILTDFGLPDMDGEGLVRRLRSLSERLRRTPIIMLTALVGAEYYDRAISAGCTDVLAKPPDFEKLQTMIKRLLLESGEDSKDTANGVQFRES